MSKTMDNDHKRPRPNPLEHNTGRENLIEAQAAEISRLNKFNTELSNVNDTLNAEIERLTAQLTASRGLAKGYAGVIDTLRARVEELEAKLVDQRRHSASWHTEAHNQIAQVKMRDEALDQLTVERDALRVELASVRDELDNWQRYGSANIPDYTRTGEKPMRDAFSLSSKLSELEAENARLRAERDSFASHAADCAETIQALETELAAEQLAHKETYVSLNALKPVVEVRYGYVSVGSISAVKLKHDNVKFIFTAGKLTGATIIGDEK